MSEAIDQIFVSLMHWLVGLFPPDLQPWVSIFVIVAGLLGVFASLFAITTVFERKGLARIQNRYGINRRTRQTAEISACRHRTNKNIARRVRRFQ